MEPTNNNEKKEELVSKEMLEAMEKYGVVLKTVFLQMQKEGYRMINGKIIKENQDEKFKKIEQGNKRR